MFERYCNIDYQQCIQTIKKFASKIDNIKIYPLCVLFKYQNPIKQSLNNIIIIIFIMKMIFFSTFVVPNCIHVKYYSFFSLFQNKSDTDIMLSCKIQITMQLACFDSLFNLNDL